MSEPVEYSLKCTSQEKFTASRDTEQRIIVFKRHINASIA